MLTLSGCPTPDVDDPGNGGGPGDEEPAKLEFAPSRNSSQDFNVLDPLNVFPQGIWSNGTIMWAADSNSLKIYAYTLFKESE